MKQVISLTMLFKSTVKLDMESQNPPHSGELEGAFL